MIFHPVGAYGIHPQFMGMMLGFVPQPNLQDLIALQDQRSPFKTPSTHKKLIALHPQMIALQPKNRSPFQNPTAPKN
jgi:hypothetical protein